MEARLGFDFGGVRVHSGSQAEQSAATVGAVAYTVGDHIVLGRGALRADGRPEAGILAHELVHVMQSSYGGAPVLLRQAVSGSTPDRPVGEAFEALDPLADYFFLVLAFGPDRLAQLEAAAARRERRRRGQADDGEPGVPELEGPLEDFLPPTATFVPREELLSRYFGALAAASGPSAMAPAIAREIGRNEAVRKYMAEKKGFRVRVELVDPDVTTNAATRLRFVVEGVEVTNEHGSIPLAALDPVSSRPLVEYTEEAGQDAAQLVSVAVVMARTEGSVSDARSTADEMKSNPALYALNNVIELDSALQKFASSVEKLRQGLRDGNQDQVPVLMQALGKVSAARSSAAEALQVARRFHSRTLPATTVGEFYFEQERATERLMAQNWEAGGTGYGWMVLNAGDWLATKIFHGAIQLTTANYVDLQATNAWRYRTGAISYEAFSENVWWDFGRSAAMLAIMFLTADIGGEVASKALGVSSSLTPAGAGAARVLGQGFVQGGLTVIGSDIYGAIAGSVTDVEGVRASQRAQNVGPAGWFRVAGWNAVLTAGLSFGEARLASPGQIVLVRPRGGGGMDILGAEVAGELPADVLDLARASPSARTGGFEAEPGFPRVSPIWEREGTRFGEAEYLARGGLAHTPTLYTEIGGKIVTIRQPSPDVVLYGPQGEVVVGRTTAPQAELYSPEGRLVFSTTKPVLPEGMEMRVWGDPKMERVPGLRRVRSSQTGQMEVLWEAYERQIARRLGAGPAEVQVSYPLSTSEQFLDRPAPQTRIRLDVARPGVLYGEAKVRGWSHPRWGAKHAIDVAGSVERMYRAAGIDAQLMPAANSPRFVVFSSQPIPVSTHRQIIWEVAQWMHAQGISPSAVYDFLTRLTFVHLRPAP